MYVYIYIFIYLYIYIFIYIHLHACIFFNCLPKCFFLVWLVNSISLHTVFVFFFAFKDIICLNGLKPCIFLSRLKVQLTFAVQTKAPL